MFVSVHTYTLTHTHTHTHTQLLHRSMEGNATVRSPNLLNPLSASLQGFSPAPGASGEEDVCVSE